MLPVISAPLTSSISSSSISSSSSSVVTSSTGSSIFSETSSISGFPQPPKEKIIVTQRINTRISPEINITFAAFNFFFIRFT